MATVLLVEDEADVAELVQEALADEGVDVQVALRDRAALQTLEAEASSFKVLVTDINLGVGVTGFDIARRARQLNRAIQVVYITGHAAHLGRFGVDNGIMFPKPFDPHELALRVKELVEPSAEAAS